MRVSIASPFWDRPTVSMNTYAHRILKAARTAGIAAEPLSYHLWGLDAKRGGLVGPLLAQHLKRYPPHESLIHETSFVGTLRDPDLFTVYDLGPFRAKPWSDRMVLLTRPCQWSGMRRARRIVTLNETVAGEIRARLGRRVAEKIRIVNVPFEPTSPFRSPEEFDVLWIGTFAPRKRLPLLLKVLREMPTMRAAVRWTPSPTNPVRNQELEEGFARAPNAVSLSQPLSSEDLDRLYRSSRCLVSTSAYEGFQLPVIEAYLRGTRVVIPQGEQVPAGRLLEGEPGVHFYRGDEPTDLRRAIGEAVEAGPFQISARVREVLSFPHVGAQLREVYEELL